MPHTSTVRGLNILIKLECKAFWKFIKALAEHYKGKEEKNQEEIFTTKNTQQYKTGNRKPRLRLLPSTVSMVTQS